MQRAAERAEQAAEAIASAFGLAKSFSDHHSATNEQILLLMTPVSLFTCGNYFVTPMIMQSQDVL